MEDADPDHPNGRYRYLFILKFSDILIKRIFKGYKVGNVPYPAVIFGGKFFQYLLLL